jgi:glycosyltransferase involved in cell wall biosynthesis
MKIVYLVTGSGGQFYCDNCYRDMLYIRAIRKVPSVTANAIPLYLPPDTPEAKSAVDSHVFFGAISLYLREKVHFLRKMPAFFDKFFDSRPLLKIAASQAGSTRSEGLENLTLSMIRGDNPLRENEINRLVQYLVKTGKPEIIHLSNALIVGLAFQLKKQMNVKIVCSLQNEDDWINEMAEPFQSKAWEMIGTEAVNVDAFISPSNYYKDFFINKTGVSGNNIFVVPSGYEPFYVPGRSSMPHAPSIGYFSRINIHNGFDKLVDAFIKLKSEAEMSDLTLHVCGGYTADDKPFIKEQIKKIKHHGFKSSCRIYTEFRGNEREEFFRNVDVMSVPARKYDAYGLYILEANGAGIPVVQPATGAFPEILKKTGGGIIYTPDNVDELSSSLLKLLTDKNLRDNLGNTGRVRVKTELSMELMASGLAEVYNEITNNKPD